MYLPLDASKARVREAENARNNRLEIVKALSTARSRGGTSSSGACSRRRA